MLLHADHALFVYVFSFICDALYFGCECRRSALEERGSTNITPLVSWWIAWNKQFRLCNNFSIYHNCNSWSISYTKLRNTFLLLAVMTQHYFLDRKWRSAKCNFSLHSVACCAWNHISHDDHDGCNPSHHLPSEPLPRQAHLRDLYGKTCKTRTWCVNFPRH